MRKSYYQSLKIQYTTHGSKSRCDIPCKNKIVILRQQDKRRKEPQYHKKLSFSNKIVILKAFKPNLQRSRDEQGQTEVNKEFPKKKKGHHKARESTLYE